MNIVSNHNRLLRGAAIPTAGGDMWTSGLEYTQNGEISGYSGSAFYQQECPCDSAAIVDSAFNKSTAWVDEQNYLTAHQDVTNLPYVQNSALEFSPQGLISGISGSGIYATSADAAFLAETANFTYLADMAYSADEANAAKWASSAEYVYNGWEVNDHNQITGYSGTAFAAGNDYSGISPIVVNNELHLISAESARLGVESPLYFVEDTSSSTVIGIYESALSGRDWTDDITAASANALNEAINQITAVELANSALTAQTAINANHANSSDSATYDSLGRKIVDTYLTAHQQLPDWTPTIQNASGNAYNSAVNWVVDQHYLTGEVEYSAGANIDITNHVVSGKDWSSEISDASANAVNEAINTITAVASANSATYDSDGNKITETYISAHQDVSNLPYVQNSALEYSPGGHLVSSISGDGLYAMSADCAFTAETANYSYVAETANYVADGWEYNASNEITGYSGSAIHSEAGGEGKVYTGVAPIVVDNSQTTGVISAQTARLGVQSPLYFVEDTSASTVIGISGDLTGNYIPYTATDTNKFFTNSAILVSAGSGFVEINSKNDTYSGEAHLHVHQKPTNNGIDEWWSEIDGNGYGHIHQHWYDSAGGETGMWYEINGFTFSTGAFEPVAEWLTGDWVNAKALYSHVNSASAGWGGGGQGIPYTATATNTFITNSAINVTGELGDPAEIYHYYITAGSTPSGISVEQYMAGLVTSYNVVSSDGTAITLSSQFRENTPESRVITYNHDKIYSGSTLVVDVVEAAKTVKSNSANWGDIPTKVVATSADATGSNILYIVTGS